MSYYDELLKKIPKIKNLLDNDTDSTIYHYTKPEKLLNILSELIGSTLDIGSSNKYISASL